MLHIPASARADVDSVLIDQVKTAVAQASDRRHRCTVVLSGDRDNSRSIANELLRQPGFADIACYSDQVPDGQRDCFGPAAFSLLGNEIDALVFDAWAGFDPDAFGALTGSIRAGGLLILLTPSFETWPAYEDPQNQRIAVFPLAASDVGGRFLQRLVRIVREDKYSLLIEQGCIKHSSAFLEAPVATNADVVTDASCETMDQQRAVEAVMKVATGHRRRPVVLVSDRGRGKSAAFGIAAARLMQEGKHVVVTAPRREAAETTLRHAESSYRRRPVSGIPATLDTGLRRYDGNDNDQSFLHFVAPDELLNFESPVDLVLVDEAAAIPGPLLEALLKRFNRIAFATTVHGYEGTGRGFALRFSRLLDKHTNSWKSLHMQTPIRWAPGDPLEQLVFRMLALDAEPARAEYFDSYQDISRYELQLLDRDALADNEPLLAEIFGLLVQAHYRTRPMDLRHLLDGPNLDVYVLRVGEHVAATALVASEGGLDAQMTEAIWAGRSRPHGHLLPETLSAHLGLMSAPELRAARVMRLTVHPALQRRGLGTRLIQEITAAVDAQGYDYLGTSFGATPELLDFWQQLDWLSVRISMQKGASSGSHSALLLKSLTAAGNTLQQTARQRFFAQFPDQLSDSLRTLEPVLVAALLRRSEEFAPTVSTADIDDLQAFAYANRLAEGAIGSLWRFTMSRCMRGETVSGLTAMQRDLLIARVLQKCSWSTCEQLVGLSGRKQALQTLRDTVSILLG